MVQKKKKARHITCWHLTLDTTYFANKMHGRWYEGRGHLLVMFILLGTFFPLFFSNTFPIERTSVGIQFAEDLLIHDFILESDSLNLINAFKEIAPPPLHLLLL